MNLFMEYKNLIYEQEKNVVTITINRPKVHNCISHETNLELQHAWKKFRDDEDAFVAIFTGAGDKAFSAGWDLNDAAALESPGTYDQFRVAVHNSEGYCGYTNLNVTLYQAHIWWRANLNFVMWRRWV